MAARGLWLAAYFGAMSLACGQASAQSEEAFFRNKTVTIYSGTSAGGATTGYGRLLSNAIGKYLPGNPSTVVKLMPGGTGLVLANWLHDVAPRDGLAFGILTSGLIIEPIVAPGTNVKYDARNFTWVGSMGTQFGVCFTWHTSPVRTMKDALSHTARLGASSSSSPDSIMPSITNAVAGSKFKIITGYNGNEIFLAMERGEIEGRCGISWDSLQAERPDWLKEKKINLLLQFALKHQPGLETVPLLSDFASEADRHALELYFAPGEVGRPFAAPPQLSAERTATLRDAFMKALKDEELIAQAAKSRLELNVLSGAEVSAIVKKMYDDASPEVVKRVVGFRDMEKAGAQ